MDELVEKLLSDLFSDCNIAGMSIAVTDRNHTIYSSGFGLRNIENKGDYSSSDTLYRVASITKVITGIVLLRLCDEKKLFLDEKISKYVPWLKLSNGNENIITIRHLLSHTSGLPVEYTPEGPREESFLEQSLKEELQDVVLAFNPQEKQFLYSNLGIRLASYIAEKVSEKLYSELAYDYALRPLGMTNSTFDLRVAATYPLSLPHELVSKTLAPQHYIKENAVRLAAGGLYSNVVDMSKLARFILNNGKNDDGEEIISLNSFNEMLNFNSKSSSEFDYGITMQRFNFQNNYFIGHLGNAAPYGSSLLVERETGYGVVVLMNTFYPELRKEIPERIFELIKEITK